MGFSADPLQNLYIFNPTPSCCIAILTWLFPIPQLFADQCAKANLIVAFTVSCNFTCYYPFFALIS